MDNRSLHWLMSVEPNHVIRRRPRHHYLTRRNAQGPGPTAVGEAAMAKRPPRHHDCFDTQTAEKASVEEVINR